MRLLVCLVLLPTLVVAQEDDKGFLTRTIEGALSGSGREVNIEGFAGALSSTASFDRMTIADAQGIWLTLEDVQLEWSRAALLRGRLMVDRLSAQLLNLERFPEAEEEPVEIPSAEATEFSLQLPELPVSVNIAAFEVAEIALGPTILGEATRMSLNAAAKLDDDGLDLDIAAERIDETRGIYMIGANVLRDGAKIDLNLALDEAAGGIVGGLMSLPGQPTIELKVLGTGQLDQFTADIDLATDGARRLEGKVLLTAETLIEEASGVNRRIQAELGGDISALIAPDYQDFFGNDVGLSVNTVLVADGSIDVEDFSLSARAVDLAGKVRLNTDLWPSFIDISGAIEQDGKAVLLPGSDAGITVQSMTLDVDYDTEQGDAFTGIFDIRDFSHDAVRIAQTALTLDGSLKPSTGSIGEFIADLELSTQGLELADASVAEAVGGSLGGAARISFIEGEPIEISGLTLSGPDYGLKGDVEIEGLENGFPTVLTVEVAAEDLSRFAALAGQPIAGAADLKVAGAITPLSGIFDLQINGTTQDIAVEIPQADALLQGRTALSLQAVRDQTGTFVRDLILKNPAVDVAADVALRADAGEVYAKATLADIALVLPQYQGAVALDATALQTTQGWSLDAKVDAPYGSRALVEGLVTGPETDFVFDVSVPEMRPIVPDVRGPLDAKGRLWQEDGQYRIDIGAGGPFGASVTAIGLATGPQALLEFTADMPDLSVVVPDIQGPLALDGTVGRDGALWRVDTDVRGPGGMTADVDGTSTEDGGTLDLKVVGQAPLALSAPFLAPRVLRGQADFDLALQGAPGLAGLSGRITTSDARFAAPNLRLGLNNLDTVIDLSGGAVNLDVDADIAAGGRLAVDGTINLTSLAADLAISLREALLTDPRIYAASLGADIDVVGPLTGGARISGAINLDEVNVTVPGTGITSIGAIPDIIHKGAANKVAQTRQFAGVIPAPASGESGPPPPAFPLNILINAPSKIFVRGRGLNAELGGDLEITGDSNNVISAGSFDLIRGRLDIIGKRFELDEGSIQFQGNVTPYIRFVSTTEIPDGTASVIVDGLATEPDITFSAVPEAPQDEVLALIIFGRSVSQLSAFQALELANGLAELSGRKGIGIFGSVRRGIGLDELDVTTSESGDTSVTAGKYITDDIYTDVTSSSQEGTDVSLNIDLTDSLKAKATVGSEGDSSLGLFFEKDY